MISSRHIAIILSGLILMSTSSFLEIDKIPVVRKHDNLDDYVGQLITIKGRVLNSKQPRIIGVDISTHNPDLRGKRAKATGILKKRIVKPEDVRHDSQNRGAGTFYRLVKSNTDYDYVKAIRLWSKN